MTKTTPFAVLAALLGALAVVLGAFGAHALKDRLNPYELGIYETAVRYQFYHVFALFSVHVVTALALLRGLTPPRALRTAGWAFFAGILIFSGSLFAIVATGVRQFGMITPFGGLAFIVGWLALARASWKLR
jgi:uncharacterized membrane protein YgdD (TMEM256/DUF423 family)